VDAVQWVWELPSSGATKLPTWKKIWYKPTSWGFPVWEQPSKDGMIPDTG
jgi:hypothetical protein